jgi:hypothetical protein
MPGALESDGFEENGLERCGISEKGKECSAGYELQLARVRA